MLNRIIGLSRLLSFIDDLGRDRRMVGPVRRDGRYFYETVQRAIQLDLSFNYCVFSPKAVFMPARQTLFRFNRTSSGFETHAVLDQTPTLLAGVHPCDVNALRLLDRVFSRAHRDEQFLVRRENTFLIGVDCARPCADGVFCADMNGNEAIEGFDLMLYPLSPPAEQEVEFGCVFGTNRGREQVVYGQVGRSPNVNDERRFEQYQAAKAASFPRMIPETVDTLPDLLNRSYDSLLWEATARRCYSCGSCNLSCPTCYCFNIQDDASLSGQSGERSREWDGCQLRDFAEVAGGHNFRPRAASRLRHRIYRKAKWIKEREGVAGCVGCARCDRACTARINSVEIYRQLAEEA